MKSDHRHELKTNELADWLAHFPEWVKENRMMLIGGAVVIVVAAGVYFRLFYQKSVVSARAQSRLTSLVTQLPSQKGAIARSLSQGTDQSYVLLDVARDLKEFANSESDDEMAALALIDHAEAIRAELHYRLTDVGKAEIAKQIALAQASYQTALERASTTPALAAKAQFGLGLCEEELGNLDKAREIYQDVVSNADYEGTVGKVEAEYRLRTMDDYKGAVVFKPAPAPPTPQASAPVIQIPSGDGSAPIVVPMPNNVTVTPAVPAVVPGANDVPGAGEAVVIPAVNAPAGG
ncbi:MAG: tetratricopeptide repeat protein [Sedimentisphaerales bacterium]|nr:tetratricopeptide repeat protein [Sedimentisphaerales bacterium]